jgi:hypothetical protein
MEGVRAISSSKGNLNSNADPGLHPIQGKETARIVEADILDEAKLSDILQA